MLVACIASVVLLSRFLTSENPIIALPDNSSTPTAVATDEEGTPAARALPTEDVAEILPGDASLPGRIVFVDEEGQLGTVGANRDAPRFLDDEGERVYLFPAWAPNGTSIATIGAERGGGGVYVIDDVAGADVNELYFSQTGAPIYLYWRPDGGAVSYIASGENSLNLYLSPQNGRGEPQLLLEGQPLYWDWLDEQSQLFVHTGTPLSDGRLTIVEASADPVLDEGPVDPGYFQAPGVSTGAANVAFAEFDGESRLLAVRNLASGDEQRTEHQGVVAMSWSPAEQILAFISPAEADPGNDFSFYGPLRLIDAETGAVSLLVDETVLAFFWSPDGQTIAYFTLARGAGEQVAESQGQESARAQGKVRRQREDLFLNLSLISVSGGQPNSLVDFRPTELFLTQFLPFFDQYALSHQLWSPDSQALVLPIVDDDRAQIYVVPVSGSGLRPVADGAVAFWSPR